MNTDLTEPQFQILIEALWAYNNYKDFILHKETLEELANKKIIIDETITYANEPFKAIENDDDFKELEQYHICSNTFLT